MFKNAVCCLRHAPVRFRALSGWNPHLKVSSALLDVVPGGKNSLHEGVWEPPLSGQVQPPKESRKKFPSNNDKDSLLSDVYLDPPATRRYFELDDASLIQILDETDTPLDAWDAYSVLLERDRQRDDGQTSISHRHCHRLAVLLARVRPSTHQVFLRLLSVLSCLKRTGGLILLYEWNLLIDRAGKGWRRVTPREYRAAVGIFKDLLATRDSCNSSRRQLLEPDVVTFCTLLNIAVKTSIPAVIDHAISLYNASGLPWTRMAQMALLPYYIQEKKLDLIPKIVVAALSEGLKIDTVNGCIWAYAYHNNMQVALELYRHLRSNIPAEHHIVASSTTYRPSVNQESHPIFCIHGFAEQATMPPDEITYRSLIQALCYYGDLVTAMSVLQDMLSTVNPLTESRFMPTMAVYRAIFLGFGRHSGNTFHKSRRPWISKKTRQKPPSNESLPVPPLSDLTIDSPWTLNNLDHIFEQFLKLEWTQDDLDRRSPSDRMVWWIMNAYARVTNGDATKIESVWQQLESRFKFGNGGTQLSERARKLLAQVRKMQDEETEYGIKPEGEPSNIH